MPTPSGPVILWAVDPFYTPVEPSPRVTEVISAWNQEHLPVKPVFVLNDIREEESWAHPDAKAALDKLMASAKASNTVEPEVIKTVQPPFTLRKLVDALNDVAQEESAQMIVVQSSNQKTPARLVFGSFAETLLQCSHVPVLLVKPQIQRTQAIQKILFASDFGSESSETFAMALKKAKDLKAEVAVFHQTEVGENQEDSEVLRDWRRQSDEAGVQLEVLIGEGHGNKAEAILHAAESEGADLIVMAARSGSSSSSRLGTTTLQVARRAKRPLLVHYSDDRKKL